jgi:lysophospholipase L1-like esterase
MLPYPMNVAKELNLDVTNKAVGGQGWFRDNNSSGKTGAQEVMSTDLSGYDLITISFAINDYMANNKSISEISDKVREVLEYVFTSNPLINCILIGPINYFNVGDASTKYARNYNKGLYTLEELNTALKTVADEYSVPFVDALHEFNVNGTNYTSVLQDKLHPNNYGYYMLGAYMAGKISELYRALHY